MRHAPLLILLLLCFVGAEAKHITGGEMIYDYLGPGGAPNTKRYRITLYLFRDQNCSNSGTCAPMPASVIIGIFNNATNGQVGGGYNVGNSSTTQLPINPLPPCITSAPDLSYTVGTYTFVVELLDNLQGYTAAYQTCCRIDGIMNVPNSVGATYTTRIPGMTNRPADFTDNSPRFAQGISVVCYDRPFTLDFSATDPDPTDSLVYSFCDAYDGGGTTNANPVNPDRPPYGFIQYTNNYFGYAPLGGQAAIDPHTGIISGIAPEAGKYVVSVCVHSFRDGVYISEQRKDFIITVAPCDLSGAQLLPDYLSCDGSTFHFENLNPSPLNVTSFWDFGDGNSSTDPNPTYTYVAAGVYTIKLVVNRGLDCSDSATAQLKVFPGFYPGFSSNAPMCKGLPVTFQDGTTANYGVPNSWKWDFGVPSTLNDTSRVQNPNYTFTTAGLYNVVLTVGSSMGCFGVFHDTVRIVDRPVFTATNDTLICSIDTLQLNITAPPGGSVVWSPNYNINNVNSLAPLVWPKVTTTYIATYSDNFGCSAGEPVVVSVVDTVTLQAMNDTTICTTDSVLLQLNSDALHYTWTPPETLSDPFIKNPFATPSETTLYTVRGRIGKCETVDRINIITVPYPNLKSSPDTSVCFGTNAFLRASGGTYYSWTPASFLNAANIPNPTAILPRLSIDYKVTVTDTLGCPKPVSKIVKLSVVKIIADAGPSDTSVVLGQPLQLTATGSVFYAWDPPVWLSNAAIANPVALPRNDIRYTVRVSDQYGCFGTDTINVKLYTIEPDLLVPSAFTPNGDGYNDVFKPIPIGMRSLDAFRVYNRWGQLLFSTTRQDHGWDGKFGGSGQDAGTYVWYAEGVDYKNRKIQRKGYVVLIR